MHVFSLNNRHCGPVFVKVWGDVVVVGECRGGGAGKRSVLSEFVQEIHIFAPTFPKGIPTAKQVIKVFSLAAVMYKLFRAKLLITDVWGTSAQESTVSTIFQISPRSDR